MKRFKNILLVCDDGSAIDPAIERAVKVALTNDASVTLMDVSEGEPGTLRRVLKVLPGLSTDEIEDQMLDLRHERLKDLSQPFQENGIPVRQTVQSGIPFVEVVRQVLLHGHDLVLKGAGGKGPGNAFLSTDMHLMRKCPCPVWIVKADARNERILAAVDPDPEDATRDQLNHTILELATSLAERDNAKLTITNTWRVQEEHILTHGRINIPQADIQKIIDTERQQSKQRFDQLLADFKDASGDIDTLHIKGVAEDVIPQLVSAEGIDTIVMGTVGRTGVSGVFIGNTAETILNRVGCSVLTVKPPNFISPVAAEPNRAKTPQ